VKNFPVEEFGTSIHLDKEPAIVVREPDLALHARRKTIN
jgi:hypothetical protein